MQVGRWMDAAVGPAEVRWCSSTVAKRASLHGRPGRKTREASTAPPATLQGCCGVAGRLQMVCLQPGCEQRSREEAFRAPTCCWKRCSTKCCSHGTRPTPADATFAPSPARHRGRRRRPTDFFPPLFYVIQMPIWQRMKMEQDVSTGAERCSTRSADCIRVAPLFPLFQSSCCCEGERHRTRRVVF